MSSILVQRCSDVRYRMVQVRDVRTLNSCCIRVSGASLIRLTRRLSSTSDKQLVVFTDVLLSS